MYCKEHKLTYEALKHLKNLTSAGDMLVSFDLTDATTHLAYGRKTTENFLL
jgi:hypothetical protein